MKCPNDQKEMDEGVLSLHGQRWFKGENKKGKFIDTGGSLVTAWKCPDCGKIELYIKSS